MDKYGKELRGIADQCTLTRLKKMAAFFLCCTSFFKLELVQRNFMFHQQFQHPVCLGSSSFSHFVRQACESIPSVFGHPRHAVLPLGQVQLA